MTIMWNGNKIARISDNSNDQFVDCNKSWKTFLGGSSNGYFDLESNSGVINFPRSFLLTSCNINENPDNRLSECNNLKKKIAEHHAKYLYCIHQSNNFDRY